MNFNKFVLFVLPFAFTSTVMAGAYVFPELGMMSVSTAGAGAQAIAEGAETAFANPAGMTRIKKATIAVNLEGSVSNIKYKDNGSTGLFSNGDSSTQAGTAMPVGSFYYVQPVNDSIAVGLAIASAGGSVIDYGENFSGSVLLQDATLLTVQLTPSISYQMTEQLSIGAGFVYEFGMLEQNFAGTSDNSLPQLKGTGESIELGYTLSFMYEVDESNRIGMIYRSETDHEMEGDIAGNNRVTPASFNIVMPNIASLSGYHKINPKFTMLWSLGWSDFSKVQQTTITLTDRSAGINREWQDTYSFSLGSHYQLNTAWRLEGGFNYETSPQDNPNIQYPDIPTGEIWKFATGASYNMNEDWRMQLYYEYLYGGQPETAYSLGESRLNGDYDIGLHYFGILLNYQF